MYWEHPSVKGVTLWGYRPGHWREQHGANLVLEVGTEKPALVWLRGNVHGIAPQVAEPIGIAELDADTLIGTEVITLVSTTAGGLRHGPGYYAQRTCSRRSVLFRNMSSNSSCITICG